MSYSIDGKDQIQKSPSPFTEKAALLKLWNAGIDREPFVFKEFYINLPFLHSYVPDEIINFM